jgi:hypothetical protein
MFKWFKPQQPVEPAALTANDMFNVIGQYGELLEKHPAAEMKAFIRDN